jgi:hypothetical protein
VVNPECGTLIGSIVVADGLSHPSIHPSIHPGRSVQDSVQAVIANLELMREPWLTVRNLLLQPKHSEPSSLPLRAMQSISLTIV